MKSLLAALLVAATVLFGAGAVGAAGMTRHGPAGIVRHDGAAAPKAAARAAKSAAISCFGASSCTAYANGIDQYFADVAHDSGTGGNVYSVDTQYCEGATTGATTCGGGSTPIAYNSTFAGGYTDTSPYPANGCNDGDPQHGVPADPICLTDAQLQTEIQHDITANGWPTGTSNLYFILTPSNVGVCFDGSNNPQCSTNYFCAYHDDFGGSGNSAIVYAVEPDNASINGCGSGEAPNGNGTDDSLNTVSHEMNEAITDPLPEPQISPGGWWSNDSNEDEIGDLCAWGFGTSLGGNAGAEYNQVINGDHYFLQQEYSNADGGCVQHLGGTATPETIGYGPLVYQGGPVMTTNTVHAIYWFPAPPANSQPPVVTGTAAVGKTLSTSNGGWSNSPASYLYQWQQCTANGSSCLNIAGATSATYVLTAIDAGHTIRSLVGAENGAGLSSYVASAPTSLVIGAPTAKAKPHVSGKAKVGKVLTANKGGWSFTPSRYRYQWLRCSAKGTGCVRIAGATKASHKLTSGDLDHRLRVTVTAVNAAGSGNSTSGASKIVS